LAVTDTLLNHLRQQLIAKVDHAQYRIGSTYTRAAVDDKRVNPDGTVTVAFYITATSGTVNQVRLRDSANAVLATKDENIVLESGTGAVYYFFTYNVYEEEAST